MLLCVREWAHYAFCGRLHERGLLYDTVDTRCYFNVRSKADMSQLNLPHGTNN